MLGRGGRGGRWRGDEPRGRRVCTAVLCMLLLCGVAWLYLATHYKFTFTSLSSGDEASPSPSSASSSAKRHQLLAVGFANSNGEGGKTISAVPKGKKLTPEELEEILKEDHRFLNVLKKKVETHEAALRQLDEQERLDYALLKALLNRTRDELANKLLFLEGRQVQAEARERRFEERVGGRERLLARTVRLGEQQTQVMEQWLDRAVEAIEQASEESLNRLKERVVQALLAIRDRLDESTDEGSESGGMKPSRRVLLSIIEEIQKEELFRSSPRAPKLASELRSLYDRKKTELKNAGEGTRQELTAIALKDYQGRPEDELSFSEGEELTIVNASPSDQWWRAKNREGREGLVPSSYLKWYDAEHSEYVAMGNRLDELPGVDQEVLQAIKAREQQIWQLESDNARLRLKQPSTPAEEHAKDAPHEAIDVQSIRKRDLLSQLRRVVKGVEGGEEEWEEIERRRYVWKDWRPEEKDLHSLHLHNGMHPDQRAEDDYLWRKSGEHTMQHQLQVLLETNAWKQAAKGRFLLYQPPPGREREHGGLNHQILALIEALAWAKLLDRYTYTQAGEINPMKMAHVLTCRALVIPLLGDGSSESYYHPDQAAGVYLNISALTDFAPVVPWNVFVDAFVGKKEAIEKQKTTDLKDRLIDFIEQQPLKKKIVYLPPASKASASPSHSPKPAAGVERRLAKIVRLGENKKAVRPMMEGHDDPGHLHTRMVRLMLPSTFVASQGPGGQRNYFLKSQGLSIAGVDEVLWDRSGALAMISEEEQILRMFGLLSNSGDEQGDEKFNDRELLVFNSLHGFYQVPRAFLHALVHAALRLPIPLTTKAREYIVAMTANTDGRYAAVHLRRSPAFRDYCELLKEREVDPASSSTHSTRVSDPAVVYDRCYADIENVIHRLKAIQEVGNYSRIFIATDLSPNDPEDVLLEDLPWVVKLNQPSMRELFPAKFDRNHMALVEMVISAHAEVFVGNLYSAFSQLTNHYRHVLGQPSQSSLFL